MLHVIIYPKKLRREGKIMSNEGIQEKRNESNSKGLEFVCQVVLAAAALSLAIVGVVRSSQVLRIFIYCLQAALSVVIIMMGVFRFKEDDKKFFRAFLYSYALVQALRAALLGTIGINLYVAAIARFILVELTATIVLFAERMEHKSSEIVGYVLVSVETALSLLFLFGFPGVMYGHTNRFLILPSVFIAGAVALLHKSRYPQLAAGSNVPDADTSTWKTVVFVIASFVIVGGALAIVSLL